MAFRNKIRLPFYVRKPQFPIERNVFRFGDGTRKIQSATVSKTYEGFTDNLPEWIHQRIAIALVHDIVSIEGSKYFGQVALDSEYEIEWEEFLDKPLGNATFKLQVTPFDASNANCKTCEEANQVVLSDDIFPESLNEGLEYSLNVFDNDRIECQPFVSSVIYFNPAYIASAAIDEGGILTITTTEEFESANGLKLLTYRVTCGNGSYDEADVFANLEGSLVSCMAPLNLIVGATDTDELSFSWDAPSPVPDEGYNWKLVKQSNPGLTIASGDVSSTNVVVGDLEGGTGYIFSVRGKCGDDEYSQYINYTASTDPNPETCGRYKLMSIGIANATYMDCGGEIQTTRYLGVKTICALETSPGNPVNLIINPGTITYEGPCV